MKASVLISKLQKLVAEYGDLEVMVEDAEGIADELPTSGIEFLSFLDQDDNLEEFFKINL